ncbi:MAG: 7-cyano-7-deazaguanine synthase QueC [Deltaproteobacteria bacterium]|nr:7-cyano-7-deazaguanine synthase QueC [Deltaproteobacteria bacterium]
MQRPRISTILHAARLDRAPASAYDLAVTTTPAPATASNVLPPAVVLLSGGLDSATVLAIARERKFACHALSFRYGQRHAVELAAAARVASALGAVQHRVAEVDLGWIGGSALTADIAVPKDRDLATMTADIPVTYVPARNTLFLSYALAWAEVLGARAIFIGVNVYDYSGYPDCRPEFLAAFEHLARLATRAGVEGAALTIHAPLLKLTKAEIVREGVRLGVDYGLTHSCYDPIGDAACGRCDSCLLRKKGFAEAGVPDPTRYG